MVDYIMCSLIIHATFGCHKRVEMDNAQCKCTCRYILYNVQYLIHCQLTILWEKELQVLVYDERCPYTAHEIFSNKSLNFHRRVHGVQCDKIEYLFEKISCTVLVRKQCRVNIAFTLNLDRDSLLPMHLTYFEQADIVFYFKSNQYLCHDRIRNERFPFLEILTTMLNDYADPFLSRNLYQGVISQYSIDIKRRRISNLLRHGTYS